MAVYYYKNSQILAPVSIVSNEPMFDMTTVSLKTRRASQGHQRWELSFNIQPTDNNIEEALLAGIDNLNSETMIMPQMPSVEERFSFSGTASLSQSANINSTTVIIADTLTNSGIIPKGYFIRFSGSDKLHIITEDISFNDNAVSKSVSIYPKLTENLASGTEMLTGSSVVFSYYKDINNQTGITFTDGVLANPGTITLLEAI
jgi:hypothetical protein